MVQVPGKVWEEGSLRREEELLATAQTAERARRVRILFEDHQIPLRPTQTGHSGRDRTCVKKRKECSHMQKCMSCLGWCGSLSHMKSICLLWHVILGGDKIS